jgi:multidrug resistance efflux pump
MNKLKQKLTGFFAKKASPQTTGNTSAAAGKKPKKINKKKRIIPLVIVAVAAVIIISGVTRSQAANVVALADTTVLSRSDIQKTVSATGTVESANYNVYTTLTFPVKEIYVADGDEVKEGDVLCILDSDSLQRQIRTKEAAMGITAETAALQVQAARDKYHSAKSALESGTNTTLISAESAVQNTYDAWINAKKTYDEYLASLQNGENAQLLSQKALLDNAAHALDSAQYTYERAQSRLDDAEDQLSDAKKDVQKARNDARDAEEDADMAQAAYEQAQRDYESAKAIVDAAGANATQQQLHDLTQATAAKDSATAVLNNAQAAYAQANQQYSQAKAAVEAAETAVDSLEDTLEQARIALESAQDNYDNTYAQNQSAQTTAGNTLASYERAVKSAYQSYQNALSSLEAAKSATQNELDAYKNALNSSKVAAKNDVALLELASMYEDLQDATVRAPVDGTITAIYVKVGSAPPSLMFVIEDTQNLKIDTTVKEFDIANVQPGMPVTIKSDATGDDVYEGKIISIAPTSAKDPTGDTISGTDVEFETEVAVLSTDTGLRIGMNVRLNYIIDQQQNVLAVPYDSVYTNASGQSCILVAIPQKKNKYLLEEYVVFKGMENDLSIVIEGAGIKEGLLVINSPQEYTAAEMVIIRDKAPNDKSSKTFGGASMP